MATIACSAAIAASDEMRLLPENKRSALGAVKVQVLNFQTFQRRDRLSAASSDAKKLLRAGRRTQNLESISAVMDRARYQHSPNWSNRLIHGESARVMASLLARENMAGKVQMIYFDPPYGVGYRSNFQVSVNQSDRTPESAEGRPLDTRTIRAFRDTYERNIHSYLDLTREKCILMRELLRSGVVCWWIGSNSSSGRSPTPLPLLGCRGRPRTGG